MPSGPKKRRAAKRKQPSTSLPTTFSFSPKSESPPAEDLFSCVTVSASKDNDDVFSKGGAGVLLINDDAKGKPAGLKGLLSSNSVTSVAGGIVEPNQKDVDLTSVKGHQILDAADAFVSRVLEETSEYDDSHTVLAGKCNDDVFSQGVADATVLINEAEGKAAGLKGLLSSNSVTSVSVTVEPIQKDLVDADLLAEHETFVADVMEELNKTFVSIEDVQNIANDLREIEDDTLEQNKQSMLIDKFTSYKVEEDTQNSSADDLHVTKDNIALEKKKQLMALDKLTTMKNDAQNSKVDLYVTEDVTTAVDNIHLMALDNLKTSKDDAQNSTVDLCVKDDFSTVVEKKQLMTLDKFNTLEEDPQDSNDDLCVEEDSSTLEEEKNCYLSFEKCTASKQDGKISVFELVAMENPVTVEIVREPNQSAGHAKSPDLRTNVQPLLDEGMCCGCKKCCLVRTLSEIECSSEENACHYGMNSGKITHVKEIIEGELKAIEKLSLVLNMALGQLSDV